MHSAGIEDDAAEVRRLWHERRTREAAVEAHRAEVERARREADWLRHAVEELDRLAPQPGEESALAERRTAMMQAEKAAEDLRATHEAVAGPQSAVPPLADRGAAAGAPRGAGAGAGRSGRQGDRCRANARWKRPATHLESALRAAEFDPGELERIEERLFALRAAGAQIQCAGR